MVFSSINLYHISPTVWQIDMITLRVDLHTKYKQHQRKMHDSELILTFQSSTDKPTDLVIDRVVARWSLKS